MNNSDAGNPVKNIDLVYQFFLYIKICWATLDQPIVWIRDWTIGLFVK